ncbi:hypothetical protein NHJ13734_005326 [Beauveria thailandica]
MAAQTRWPTLTLHSVASGPISSTVRAKSHTEIAPKVTQASLILVFTEFVDPAATCQEDYIAFDFGDGCRTRKLNTAMIITNDGSRSLSESRGFNVCSVGKHLAWRSEGFRVTLVDRTAAIDKLFDGNVATARLPVLEQQHQHDP